VSERGAKRSVPNGPETFSLHGSRITRNMSTTDAVAVRIVYSSNSHESHASTDAALSLAFHHTINAMFSMKIDCSVTPGLTTPYFFVYFFPLFLIPWAPVFRGPLLPLAFAAISAFALASATHQLKFKTCGPWKTNQPSASLEMPCLPHPSLPWELSLGPSKA